jgi:hypothetical protein
MLKIATEQILIKHLIKFDYKNKDKSIFYKKPHHLFAIEDSIHFKALEKNNFEIYKELIETTQQKEHSEDVFKNLIEDFDFEKLKEEKNKITILWDKNLRKFLIEDGSHRMAIIKYKKLDKEGVLPLEIFKIKL